MGVAVYLRQADALEKVEGGAEALLDAAAEQPGAAADGAAQVGAVNAGLAEEEGDDRGEVGYLEAENLGAHAGDAAEVDGGEVEGGEEVDGGSDVGEGDGDDGRVEGGDAEEVDAVGFKVEHLFLEAVGVGGMMKCRCRGYGGQ